MEVPKEIGLLKAGQVAKILGVSVPLIYKMAERGQLPCVRWECPGVGEEKRRSMIRFRKNDIVSFVRNHLQGV